MPISQFSCTINSGLVCSVLQPTVLDFCTSWIIEKSMMNSHTLLASLNQKRPIPSAHFSLVKHLIIVPTQL